MIPEEYILKKVLRLILSVFILLMGSNAMGQTVDLPDTNFRNALLTWYPSVMSGDQLDVTAANSFTPDLILRNVNISDLAGIEHFTSVFKIDASGNNLTSLPDLSANTNLEYLYLNNNQLTDISFMLNNRNLLQLQLFNNQLTYFPALPGFVRLQQLFLSNNKITSIEDVSNLTNLSDLQIGNNMLTSLPDLSQNTNLVSLHFHQNNISDISDLIYLSKLKDLYCWNTNITDLNSLNDNTSLQVLVTFGNELSNLPLLSNKPGLTTVEVADNQLTFEDLLPLTDLTSLTTFTYAPQDSVGVKSAFSIRALNPLQLKILEDAGVSSNIFFWYKNGTQVFSSFSSVLTIQSSSPADSGEYSASITNPALPLLTLHHRPWKITVLPCMEITSYGYRILSKDCDAGTTLQTEIIADGAQAPLSYILNSITGDDSISSASDIIPDIPAGAYKLSIRDQRGCQLSADTNLTIYNTSGCSPVIAPVSNSHESSYFIEGTGEVKILDMKGKVIRTLQAPAVWDGTTSEGNLADAGYYVITLNNKKLTNISVLR